MLTRAGVNRIEFYRHFFSRADGNVTIIKYCRVWSVSRPNVHSIKQLKLNANIFQPGSEFKNNLQFSRTMHAHVSSFYIIKCMHIGLYLPITDFVYSTKFLSNIRSCRLFLYPVSRTEMTIPSPVAQTDGYHRGFV